SLGARKDALAGLRAALEYDADNDRLRARVAEIEMTAGEGRQAAADLATVLHRRPADAESWNLLGVLLMEHGQREEAVRCWKRAAALAPGFDLPAKNLKKAPSFPMAKGRSPLVSRETTAALFEKRP